MVIISSLPDPILCHILSFLPVNFSVRTSVLARRWRFLWTSVPNLYFDEQYYGSDLKCKLDFPDMVDRVLPLHKGPLDSLSIRPYDETKITGYQIDSWISTAIARNVQVLHVSDLSVPLSQLCFKCTNLVELTIEYCTVSVKPGVVCLPKLKKINLLSNFYEDQVSLTSLLSECLALENLVIERDSDYCDTACFYVCSPTIKSLVLTCSAVCCEENHEHKLVLNVPAVQYLRINDDISSTIRAENLSALVAADISLGFNYPDFYWDDEETSCPWRDIFQFLENLSNAKSLTFRSSFLMEIFNPTFSIATTRFCNLTQLKLEADWHFLTELLESAYNLESLSIEKVVVEQLDCWKEPKHLPKCLSSSLQYVSIFRFAGEDDELNMVRYILKHAQVLKTMKIHYLFGRHVSKRNMLRRISKFPRRSEKCQLTFVENGDHQNFLPPKVTDPSYLKGPAFV